MPVILFRALRHVCKGTSRSTECSLNVYRIYMCVSLGIHHAVQRRIPPMISTCTGRYLVYLHRNKKDSEFGEKTEPFPIRCVEIYSATVEADSATVGATTGSATVPVAPYTVDDGSNSFCSAGPVVATL